MSRAVLFCITLAAVAGCEVAPGPRRESPTAASGAASATAAAAAHEAAPPPAAPPPAVDAGAAAPTPPAPTPPAPPPPTPPAPTGSGEQAVAPPAAPPAAPAKDACVKASGHLFDVEVATLQDGAQKANLLQNRTTYVNQLAQNCTAEAWSDAVIDCINKAVDPKTLGDCSDLLKNEQGKQPPAAAPPAAH